MLAKHLRRVIILVDSNYVLSYNAGMKTVAQMLVLLPLLWIEGLWAADLDDDGIDDGSDNCVLVSNFAQVDTDGDGDLCDQGLHHFDE